MGDDYKIRQDLLGGMEGQQLSVIIIQKSTGSRSLIAKHFITHFTINRYNARMHWTRYFIAL